MNLFFIAGVCLTPSPNVSVKLEHRNGIHAVVLTQPDTRMPQQEIVLYNLQIVSVTRYYYI